MFVVLEGIDNSGKSYQAYAVKEELGKEGVRVVVHKDLFQKIFEMLRRRYDRGMFSPFAEAMISGALALFGNGETVNTDADVVIVDRFIHTVLAYGEPENRSAGVMKDLDRVEMYDLGIYIDVTPEEAMERSRRAEDGMRHSGDYLSAARENYLGFVEKGELVLVDGIRSREEVTEEIVRLVKEKRDSLNES